MKNKIENKNPLRLPWKSIGCEFDGFGIVNCEGGLVVECLTLNKMQRDAILNGVNERAALEAVAEAAHALRCACLEQNCHAGFDPERDAKLAETKKLSENKLGEALANLAAIQKGAQS